MSLRAGELVEIRSKAEILATLDDQGRLDQMPFMPEMFAYCGRRFTVWKRAHKTCDTVNRTGGRRVRDAVHLQELRCDGAAHGGCEAGCLLFWKEAWLKRVTASARVRAGGQQSTTSEQQVLAATVVAHGASGTTYSCQATRLPEFTTELKWWDLRQYVEDYVSGNVSLRRLIAGAAYVVAYGVIRRAEGWSSAMAYRLIKAYNLWQRLWGGVPYPRLAGKIRAGEPTPIRTLNLQPGEVVRVLPYATVLETLDGRNKNRGMYFDAEEVPFCGKSFRVRSRVSRIINERTGEMIQLQGENVLLENAWCQARYSDRRMHCPRAIFPIWKSSWLERTAEPRAEE